jgi:hypothetical protein
MEGDPWTSLAKSIVIQALTDLALLRQAGIIEGNAPAADWPRIKSGRRVQAAGYKYAPGYRTEVHSLLNWLLDVRHYKRGGLHCRELLDAIGCDSDMARVIEPGPRWAAISERLLAMNCVKARQGRTQKGHKRKGKNENTQAD